MRGINLSETKEYYSDDDKSAIKTKWTYGAIDSEIYSMLGDGSRNPIRIAFDAVRFGLKNFENFKDAQGNEVAFSTISITIGTTTYKIVSPNIMKIIPPQLINDLGEEILKMSRLNEEEIKN